MIIGSKSKVIGIILGSVLLLAGIVLVIYLNFYNCAEWNKLWFFITLVIFCIDFIVVQTVIAIIRKLTNKNE